MAAAFQGIGNTFQWPAYSAAITTMVPKEQLGRANGMMSLLDAGPGVLAPILAGVLLPVIALTGILTIDVADVPPRDARPGDRLRSAARRKRPPGTRHTGASGKRRPTASGTSSHGRACWGCN